MTGESIDGAIAILDEHLRGAPVHVSIAWRSLRGALRRSRRISSTTLPHLAAIAQQAIIVRDVLRSITALELGPRADRTIAALDHAEALVKGLGTGAPEGGG